MVSAAAFVATALLILITAVYGCGGSDVSEPPPEGSAGDLLCSGPAWVLHLGLGGVAVIAPLLAISPWPRWLDLRVGFAISAAAFLVLSLLGEAISPRPAACSYCRRSWSSRWPSFWRYAAGNQEPTMDRDQREKSG